MTYMLYSIGSTPTRFRQLLDDSTAFVGVEARKPAFRPWVLFPNCSQIFLALLLFVAVASAQPHTIRVPFHTVHNLILLDVQINGKPRVMVLDTGSPFTIVSTAILNRKFDLQDSQGAVGIQGQAHVATVDLALGEKRWKGRRVVAMNLTATQQQIGTEIDGLLGQDALQEFPAVRIDFKNQVVELEAK